MMGSKNCTKCGCKAGKYWNTECLMNPNPPTGKNITTTTPAPNLNALSFPALLTQIRELA